MNTKFLTIFMAVWVLFTTLKVDAATPLQADKKEAVVESLDARINRLQEARDCIDAAKTREAVKACRANIKVAKKNLKELREASKASSQPAATPVDKPNSN